MIGTVFCFLAQKDLISFMWCASSAVVVLMLENYVVGSEIADLEYVEFSEFLALDGSKPAGTVKFNCHSVLCSVLRNSRYSSKCWNWWRSIS